MNETESMLDRKGIKATPNRVLVAQCLNEADCPVSMADIEEQIKTIDKSSVFRVLMHFVEKDFVHVIDDGSGSLRYELCRGEKGHTIDDMHVHFKCENCGKLFCFENQKIPAIQLPEGFSLFTANYVGKGLCKECTKSAEIR